MGGHVARMGKRWTHIGYYWESRKDEDHWEDQDTDGCLLLRWILEGKNGDERWISLAQDIGQWRAVVKAVLNLRIPWNAGNYSVASRVVLSSIDSVS
jgi:hypothetical protein